LKIDFISLWIEDILPQSLFIRVHRSYIINKKVVSSIVGKDITIDEVKISLSARYSDALKNAVFINIILSI
jgi:DNA-binding LytR/AlgR family response regulator